MKAIEFFTNTMTPVSLQEMDAVTLMDRVDTKYVCPASLIPSILEIAKEFYRILEIDNRRIMSYKTNYYDTSIFSMYLDHQNGKLNRYKIREREYADSGLSFLEVKFKTNKNRTIKSRIKRITPGAALTPQEKAFLSENSPYAPGDLVPKLVNNFNRITLANRSERITIDFNVSFSNTAGISSSIESVAIIEVKQKSHSPNTPIGQILKWLNIHLSSSSKYCIGVASLYSGVKANKLKPVFRTLNSLNKKTSSIAPALLSTSSNETSIAKQLQTV